MADITTGYCIWVSSPLWHPCDSWKHCALNFELLISLLTQWYLKKTICDAFFYQCNCTVYLKYQIWAIIQNKETNNCLFVLFDCSYLILRKQLNIIGLLQDTRYMTLVFNCFIPDSGEPPKVPHQIINKLTFGLFVVVLFGCDFGDNIIV